jgi:predicted ester cyclase
MILAGPNARILGAYSARMVEGDYGAVYDYFAEGFSSHVTARAHPESIGKDVRDVEVRYWRDAKAAFPDAKWTVNALIERDDMLVSNWTLEGTHTGAPFFGVPPSGERVEINGTAILRFENGKIVEHWGGPHCARGIGLLLPE